MVLLRSFGVLPPTAELLATFFPCVILPACWYLFLGTVLPFFFPAPLPRALHPISPRSAACASALPALRLLLICHRTPVFFYPFPRPSHPCSPSVGAQASPVAQSARHCLPFFFPSLHTRASDPRVGWVPPLGRPDGFTFPFSVAYSLSGPPSVGVSKERLARADTPTFPSRDIFSLFRTWQPSARMSLSCGATPCPPF